MLTLKFLAGLGTILLFGAFFCFKAAFGKKNYQLHGSSTAKNKKWRPLVLGIICTAAGIFIFIRLISLL